MGGLPWGCGVSWYVSWVNMAYGFECDGTSQQAQSTNLYKNSQIIAVLAE
jgi:hypothetical protein